MKKKKKSWNRNELKTYLLLLCANADFVETPIELRLIGSRVDEKSFDKIYSEFSTDSEEKRLEKISTALAYHDLSPSEVSVLKKEIKEVFEANAHISVEELKLQQLLDRLLKK